MLHYSPSKGYFGDPIPFYAMGRYHVFYDMIKPDGKICWGHISSLDLLNWEEHSIAIDNGAFGSWDEQQCITGSIVKSPTGYHAFYTGMGRSGPAILTALSTDLDIWEKESMPVLERDNSLYRNDITWRDPHVFWNDDEQLWWMILCARQPWQESGAVEEPFPGVLALAKSADLQDWELFPPLWNPGYAKAIECPDMFQISTSLWMLVFFYHTTEIRLASSPYGPWLRGKEHAPTSFDFFSGKTMADPERRILIGWIPRKDHDCAHRTWGGNMAIARELYLLPNGTPAVRCASEVIEALMRNTAKYAGGDVFSPASGNWSISTNRLAAASSDRGSLCIWKNPPKNYLMRGNLVFNGGLGSVSIIIRTRYAPQAVGVSSSPVDVGYELRLSPAESSVVLIPLYEWMQRPPIASINFNFPNARPMSFELFVEDDIVEFFIDERKSLVSRLLDHNSGGIALFVQELSIVFEDVRIMPI
jgi:beta-fructofuranosidase